MSRLLEKLYCGNISPADAFCLSTPEYGVAKKKYDECLERFYEKLSKAQRHAYFELEDAFNEVTFLEQQQAFVNGFHLGGALILEVYEEKCAAESLPCVRGGG